MIDKTTQDKLQIFQGPLEKKIVDWTAFHNLEQDERAEAERILQNQNYISPDPKGNYELIVGRAGIHKGYPVPQIDNTSAYITTEEDAQNLVEYLISKNLTARIKRHE